MLWSIADYPLGTMDPRFAAMPRSLAAKARIVLLGPTEAPALLAHPDWMNPAPVLLWYHGRSVSKELDPGRYLRLIRAGIAICAVDLPGHGQRPGPKQTGPKHSVQIVTEAVAEVPHIVEALGKSAYAHLFDRSRIAIGGMSAGGMVSLRALCEPDHPFCAALVESTAGRLGELYQTDRHIMQSEEEEQEQEQATVNRTRSPHPRRTQLVDRDHFPTHDPAAVAAIDPAVHLHTWPRPIPLLAIHSRLDQVVPFTIQQGFLDDLRAQYRTLGADPSCVELLVFEKTGAPMEHAGFGKLGAQAKDAATKFLVRVLIDGQRCG